MNEEDAIKLFSNCHTDGNKIVIENDFKNIVKSIKNDYNFEILKQITAIDHQQDGIELIYHFYDNQDDEDLLISSTVKNEIETITDIFESAVADENEIYDLFGINFIGNENLKRLYMPEDWEGFPLRKDYVQDDTRLALNDGD